MFKLILLATLSLPFLGCTGSTTLAAPAVPATLSVPAGNKLALVMHADGVQIYTCAPAKDDSTKYEWAFKAPEAKLTDADGRDGGKHYAGPIWESSDGSKVTGKVEQKVDAPAAGDIQWLLLSAKSNEGTGAFGKVTFIQRLETHGGKAAPEGCDAAHVGQEQRVPYKATYYFYVAGA
jgi:hypothetical protein